MRTFPTVAVLCTALSSVTRADGIAVFLDESGGMGSVVLIDPQGKLPPEFPSGLGGIRLLDLEVNGRTWLERFEPGRAWRSVDIPQAARIMLPAGQGSLYHFSRPEGGGQWTYGYFVLDEAGKARVVVDATGTGAAADQDPFLGRVAIASDGKRALVATTLDAGGNLLEVDLETATVLDRTSQVPAQSFFGQSLQLGFDWGLAVSASGIWRYEFASQLDAALLDYAGASAPTGFTGEVVLSRNAQFAAAVTGSDPSARDFWLFSKQGQALRANSQPMAISNAGWLPDTDHGPYLAVSDDGVAGAWRVEGAKREAFLAHLQFAPGASVHVTADPYFIDTLDEIGQFSFRPGLRVLQAFVGSISLPEGTIENADLYQMDLESGGALSLTNVTLTSGSNQIPFPAAAMTPDRVHWLPSEQAFVFFAEQSGGTGALAVARPGQAGLQILLNDVKELYELQPAGNEWVVFLRRSSGDKPFQAYELPQGLQASPLLVQSSLDTEAFTRFSSRDDGAVAFSQSFLTHEFLWVWNAPANQLTLLTTRELNFGSPLGVGPSGEFTFSVGSAGNPAVFARWPFPSSVKRLPLAPAPGFVLPSR